MFGRRFLSITIFAIIFLSQLFLFAIFLTDLFLRLTSGFIIDVEAHSTACIIKF